MQKNLPAILIGVFTIALIGGLICAYILTGGSNSSSSGSPGSAIPVGASAPLFSLKDTNNTPFSLSTYIGKNPIFLEFFAVWCPHCQRMAPIVEDLYTQYGTKVTFVSVQASPYGRYYESEGNTSPATLSDLQWFKSNFGIQYPILQDQSIATANKYGVQGFPTFYIINSQGKVSYTSSGETDEATLAKAIQKDL